MSREIDRWLGRHLMGLRQRRGMSYSDIADLLDTTPADIESFEKGTTRMTAACLLRLTRKLDVSLPMFFLDVGQESEEQLAITDPTLSCVAPSVAEGLELMKLFYSIKDPAKRAAVLNIVSAVASTLH